MPRREEAAVALGREALSTVWTSAEVVEAGTAMVAVMSTEAAATVMVTAEASTPTTAAIAMRSMMVSA